MRYYIKFIFLSDSSLTLLYGFCAPTEKPLRNWQERKLNKRIPLVTISAIVSEEERELFEQSLIQNTPFNIGKKLQKALSLTPRPQTLSGTEDNDWEKNNPVAKLHKVNEYWQLNKCGLIDAIEQLFPDMSGNKRRKRIISLFGVIKQECGIDFSKKGERLGNFEFYQTGRYINSFEVTPEEENKCVTIIKKKEPINCLLYVSCSAENEGRWISDECKQFLVDDSELRFSAEEPMSRVKVKIWDADNGEIVFVKEYTLMLEMSFGMNIIGSTRIIQDPWSEKLRNSAGKYKSEINDIETNKTTYKDRDIHVKNDGHAPWRAARNEGQNLCKIYGNTQTKGAFIPATDDRKGEIDSFKKIREYIEEDSVKRIVLADPYFSMAAAAKILARIQRPGLRIEIVTSLVNTDPDNNESDNDILIKYKDIMEKNRNVLHNNLTIKNLTRGNTQVFHDRYLIRYHTDGHIDGFLLSNSLNSMGQRFPFAIVPIETDVCMEIDEYLYGLTDRDVQQSTPKTLRIDSEIIFDGKQEATAEDKPTPVLPKMLSGKEELKDAIEACINIGFFKPDSTEQYFYVISEKHQEIIKFLWENWDKNHYDIIIALGEMMYHSNNAINNIATYLQDIPNAVAELLTYLPKQANSVELQQNHSKQRIDGDQYVLWAILSGKAKTGSVAYWLGDGFRVHYKEGYWTCLYDLLLKLSPSLFMNTMKETNSPLMLAKLVDRLARHNLWDEDIYNELLSSPWEWATDLSAQWLWQIYEDKQSILIERLDLLPPVAQLGQSAYLLSRAIFGARLPKPDATDEQMGVAWDFCYSLIRRIALLCDNEIITFDDCKRLLQKANDCEERCDCWIKLEIAKNVNRNTIRNFLLDEAISILSNRMKKGDLPYQGLTDREFVQFGVDAFILRNGKDAYENAYEIICDNILAKSAFYDWNEPYLKDRDYSRWHYANKVVRWQLQFLYEFNKRGGILNDVLQRCWDIGNNQTWDIGWET